MEWYQKAADQRHTDAQIHIRLAQKRKEERAARAKNIRNGVLIIILYVIIAIMNVFGAE